MSQAQIKFLQISDALFDSPSALESLELAPAQRRERTEEGFLALERALALAAEEKVDAVIVAGNLFHSASVSLQTVARLQSAFAVLHHTPIIIAPGEFDPWSATSFYAPQFVAASGMTKWPTNVYVFSKPEHVTIRLPACAGVTITCRPFVDGVEPLAIEPERLAALHKEDSPLKVLIKPFAARSFDAAEMENSARSFSYLAGGGLANARIEQCAGKTSAAFSGSLFGQSTQDVGDRSALIVSVKTASGAPAVSIEKHGLDLRRIVCACVDVTNQESDRYAEVIENALSSSGARENRDIVVLRLIGLHEVGNPVPIRMADLQSRYYHVKVENLCRPDYEKQRIAPSQTELRFLKLIEEMKVDATTTPGVSNLLDHCKYIGLAALRQGRVKPGDAS
ncbi:MAG: hypothetical protein K2W95_04050 [Candidatus Obscuribacterales bacterium]|nr:hypothetical protein [Candidatus Obscuribacterales bacterium]